MLSSSKVREREREREEESPKKKKKTGTWKMSDVCFYGNPSSEENFIGPRSESTRAICEAKEHFQ